ncbi:MAG: hypothetical protein IPK15_19140 [Verrucomicrobia bacterium]|nr:hypothetical protein [Verrucomicrobiota bacterium]
MNLQKAVAKKRTFWVGAVVTSIVLILLLKSARSGDEVRFNGRTVSGWVYATSHYSTVETNQQLQAMMDNLGSNAIPPLLAILEAGEGKTASLYRKIALSSSPGWIKRFALGQLDKKIQPLTIALGLTLPEACHGCNPLEVSLPGPAGCRSGAGWHWNTRSRIVASAGAVVISLHSAPRDSHLERAG